MEIYKVSKPANNLSGVIHLTASKSESNRALIIQALCQNKFPIHNLAIAEDTQILQQLINSDSEVLDVGAAGAPMRFLTAFLSCKEGTRILTGSERMKQRPIKILVDALNELGAEIVYLEKEGYPPLKITGKKLTGGEIEIDGNISSQYISALLLIAPILPQGLTLNIKGRLTSRPYVNMTIEIMKHFGAKINRKGNTISVSKQPYISKPISIEADWSAASYWYEMAALAEETDLIITGPRKDSWQGDAIISTIYESFGVETIFMKEGIRLVKNQETPNSILPAFFNYDFSDCPDIAQTVAVTMAGLNIPGVLSGLHSLRIKETDRIHALQTELSKMKVKTEIKNESLIILSSSFPLNNIPKFKTYNDHRMAMAFAPLAIKIKEVAIENPEAVDKSYPGFWNDLKLVGFEVLNM